ncbi:anthranilate synthase component I [Bacillus sp. FJAT-49736]|uniref:anthranilate synthase component I n=1 Tax=Bacillus sp. FJAT-49736 TaxID=2833582 RepID=UPI0020161957|nr:anthranilate synthase component I [Bacillus sp. FJAT-49736]
MNQIFKISTFNGDTLTPIVIFNRLKGKKKFLLESSLHHDEKGRYSFIGMNPYFEFQALNNQITLHTKEQIIQEQGIPLEILKDYLPHLDVNLPFPFYGGGIGFIGYDAIRQYENIGEILHDKLQMPDIHLMFFQDVIIFDHVSQNISIVLLNLNQQRTEAELENTTKQWKEAIFSAEKELPTVRAADIIFTPIKTKEDFLKIVQEAKQYIQEGDIFQVVLSQQLEGEVSVDPFHFYRKLRNANPSPYMFYIDFEDYIILGASPESLVQTKGKELTTNPIAGTKPRGKNKEEDLQREQELLTDEKELAEHKMLLDLSRNDAGKVCEAGSITLSRWMEIERYQHIMHIVSEVKGRLKSNLTGIDALIACLPAGTVSGAPKIRAMQIINDLEKRKRGVYGGAVGYINVNGDIDFALAIRSLVIKEAKAYLQTGAGIVYDSVPEIEYEETMNKAKALREVNNNDLVNR